MDHLSGGRFILGLGVSGPQVVEGWYGQPFAKPLARTREYIAILRDILRARGPVTAPGQHYPLPLPGRDGAGQAAEVDAAPAARGHPDLPRRRGPEERRAVRRDLRRLAGALLLADATRASTATRWPRASRAHGARRSFDDFEVCATVPLHRPRRRRGGRRHAAPDVRPVLRRHGRARRELPPRRRGPHGLRGRGRSAPGPLPRRPQGRGRRRAADAAGRGARAHRARATRSATTSRPGASRS